MSQHDEQPTLDREKQELVIETGLRERGMRIAEARLRPVGRRNLPVGVHAL